MKHVFSRSEYRLVTTYYSTLTDDEDSDYAYELFLDGDREEIGFNVGKLADLDHYEDEYIGSNPPKTDYPRK
jgi:hypothetical protein